MVRRGDTITSYSQDNMELSEGGKNSELVIASKKEKGKKLETHEKLELWERENKAFIIWKATEKKKTFLRNLIPNLLLFSVLSGST